VADLPAAFSGAGSAGWQSDGKIVFTTGFSGLLQLPEKGGDPSPLLNLEADDADFHDVSVLPENRGVLFAVHRAVQGVTELTGDKDRAALARESFAKTGWRGFLLAMADKTRRPRRLPSYHLTIFYVALGENDLAIDQLTASYDDRDADMCWLKTNPRFDALRGDPRFQQLIAKVGFP
jgi:hypothetical protein